MEPAEEQPAGAGRPPVSPWVERMVDAIVWTAVVVGALYAFEPSAQGVLRALVAAILCGVVALVVVGTVSLVVQVSAPRSGLRLPGRASRWLGLDQITWQRAIGVPLGIMMVLFLRDMIGGLLGRDLVVVIVNGAVALGFYVLFTVLMRVGGGSSPP